MTKCYVVLALTVRCCTNRLFIFVVFNSLFSVRRVIADCLGLAKRRVLEHKQISIIQHYSW